MICNDNVEAACGFEGNCGWQWNSLIQCSQTLRETQNFKMFDSGPVLTMK